MPDWVIHLTLTFDLESYIRTFSIQDIYFEWPDLTPLFSVWKCIFRISRSRFSFQVMGLRSRSLQRENGSVQLEKFWWKDRNICYENARSNLELLTLWPWPLILRHNFVFFKIQALCFECLKITASFSENRRFTYLLQCEGTSLEYLGHLRV